MLYTNPLEKLSDLEIASVDNAIECLQVTDRIGLAAVLDVKLGLAMGNLIRRDKQVAEQYLREAYDHAPQNARQILVEFLVSQGRQEEAQQLLSNSM